MQEGAAEPPFSVTCEARVNKSELRGHRVRRALFSPELPGKAGRLQLIFGRFLLVRHSSFRMGQSV